MFETIEASSCLKTGIQKAKEKFNRGRNVLHFVVSDEIGNSGVYVNDRKMRAYVELNSNRLGIIPRYGCCTRDNIREVSIHFEESHFLLFVNQTATSNVWGSAFHLITERNYPGLPMQRVAKTNTLDYANPRSVDRRSLVL